MRHPYESRRPRVFLSFAGVDRPVAKRLRDELRQHHIDVFLDEESIAVGSNAVLGINSALAQSDYYVLLWSRAAQNRPWVEMEWSAALTQELAEHRSFLFVVRMDRTPMPPLLAPRRYLDAFTDWDAVVRELITAWARDQAVRSSGATVLPAPCAGPASAILLYVRNDDLSVAHVVAVGANSTGAELYRLVRGALQLPEQHSDGRWNVGLRFGYRLGHGGTTIATDETRALADLGISDGSTVTLEVRIEQFGPTGPVSTPVTYRDHSPRGLSPAMLRSLVHTAFAHLMP